jgi:hypothetical protein
MNPEMLEFRHKLCAFLGEPDIPEKCRETTAAWIGFIDKMEVAR